jgi:hypothetical protein
LYKYYSTLDNIYKIKTVSKKMLLFCYNDYDKFFGAIGWYKEIFYVKQSKNKAIVHARDRKEKIQKELALH